MERAYIKSKTMHSTKRHHQSFLHSMAKLLAKRTKSTLSQEHSSPAHHQQISPTSLRLRIIHRQSLTSPLSQSSRYKLQCKGQPQRKHQDPMEFLIWLYEKHSHILKVTYKHSCKPA